MLLLSFITSYLSSYYLTKSSIYNILIYKVINYKLVKVKRSLLDSYPFLYTKFYKLKLFISLYYTSFIIYLFSLN